MKPGDVPMYKVQLAGLNGWYDLKETEDDGKSYKPSLYVSKAQAKADIEEIQRFTDGPHEEFRIVPASTPEDWSPYCD